MGFRADPDFILGCTELFSKVCSAYPSR